MKTHLPIPTKRRTALRVTLAAAVLALAGCAGLQPLTTEQIVAERAEARWNDLIKGNFEKAWDYTQPGFRAVVPRDRYFRRFQNGGQWTGVQVHQVRCEAERCTVRLRISAKVLVAPFKGQEIATAMDEVWVREDGQWWYFQAF